MLKYICNYKEQEVFNDPIQISYIGMKYELPDSTILEIKSENREIVIDNLMGDMSDDEYKEKKEKLDEKKDYLSYGGSIMPMIYSLSINGVSYVDESIIYDRVISFIDTNTQNAPILPNYIIYRNNVKDLSNKLEIMISLFSNYIAVNGRIGYPNTIILGKNLHNIKFENRNNMNIVYDDNMDPDKVILCRTNNIDQSGIILINDTVNNKYYLKETSDWINQFNWFWIK